ncbi:hypothetical protein L615_007600000150 [Nocardioides sp. J9]|uniref:hypothetical protein n=1 Tax=Nocardioides sp. J9 TaxID=935844 RepID=UPI0011A1E072|nr:hypothetical protein [Nocardioides sp. J9]TWG91891.1 hypothetical protein L615_007600000150 [Nocardioides sp. J9]
MTWTAYHNRGETLRAVITASSQRRDGVLPTDVEGVAETFHDELDLLGALVLKWHTRLAGNIEQMLAHQPTDLDEAVAVAWSNTAHELPGVRMIIDHYRAEPVDDAMARAMAKAAAKEHYLLAVMAGRASLLSEQAALRAGAAIEERARELHRTLPPVDPAEAYEEPQVRGTLLERLRAVLAA